MQPGFFQRDGRIPFLLKNELCILGALRRQLQGGGLVFLAGGNFPSQVLFNFILPGKAEVLSPQLELPRFLCFHLLLAADNNSANGFGNRKFPLGFVGFFWVCFFFPLSLGKWH